MNQFAIRNILSFDGKLCVAALSLTWPQVSFTPTQLQPILL